MTLARVFAAEARYGFRVPSRGTGALGRLLAACLCVAAAAGGGSAHAAFPGVSGRIVFATNHDPGGSVPAGPPELDLFTVDPDGGKLKRLTDNKLFEYAPAWSPDGRRIAFQRGTSPLFGRIYVMRADGKRAHAVTPRPRGRLSTGADYDPAWSPNGRRIAFASRRARCPGICIVSLRSGRLRHVRGTRLGDREPAWSPDGRRIAFTRDFGTAPGVTIVTAGGGRPHRLALRGYAASTSPSWSPGGRWLAVAGGVPCAANGCYEFALARVGLKGRGQRELVSDAVLPAWSPDGKLLAVIRHDGLLVVQRDGSDPRRVFTPGDGATVLDPDWQPLRRR